MTVTVREVTSPDDFQSFLGFATRLHHQDPSWAPLLPELYERALNRETNPYFEHADGEYLLAWRDGEVVGHVVAHVDHLLNDYHRNRWGLFGFFEAVDDQDVADALLDGAARWLRERGRDRMVGPLQFSTKGDPGLLIEGCDRRPVFLQPWHPLYYRRLLEQAGLTKAKDVVWRELVVDGLSPDLLTLMARWATTVKKRHGVTIRTPDQGSVEADLERMYRFMPPFFESDWGYVPLTDAELGSVASAGQMLGSGTLLAELDGELIGVSMMVPDFRQTLGYEDGRVVRLDRKIDQARLMITAVAPEHRHLGVMPALFHEHIEQARARGFGRIVIGWSYEDNETMNDGMAALSLEVTRRHRIYEKVFELSPP